MDIEGRLWVYGRDGQYHTIFCDCGAQPYRFDGSECMTADCLPKWTVDAYYTEKLPESLKECIGR